MLIKNKGFTLIEILIAIIILTLLALGINSISLMKISDFQKLGIFKNKIENNIKSAVNNSLAGKAVDNALKVPKYWKIEINNTPNLGAGTGNIIISYGSGTFQIYNNLTIKANKFYSIENIVCDNLDGTNQSTQSIVEILIENGNIILNSCPDNDQKLIKFDVIYKGYRKNISINSINNIINSN